LGSGGAYVDVSERHTGEEEVHGGVEVEVIADKQYDTQVSQNGDQVHGKECAEDKDWSSGLSVSTMRKNYEKLVRCVPSMLLLNLMEEMR
jgi:hypothetical protein